MLGEGAHAGTVGWESPSPLLEGVHFWADTTKSSAPERTQKGASLEIFFILARSNVRAQDKT